MQKQERKVVVIGAGFVGATYVYALMHTGLAGEIVLVDLDQKRLKGEVMDLEHGLAFVQPVEIRAGDYSDCADANLIVVTAGAKQIPGQSRLELTQRNADIVKSICDQINRCGSEAVLVMVANPVDVLTQVALKRLDWPRERVIGSGTVLDSARFRSMLGRHCGVDTRNIHAYILGEHGDSEVAAWSMTNLAGISIDEYCPVCGRCYDWETERREIEEAVRRSAYHIIDYKGATYYAVGFALVRIVGAILRNEMSVLSVSTVLDGEYDIRGVSLGVPSVVCQTGVKYVMEAKLSPKESEALSRSASILRDAIAELKRAR